MDIEITGQAAKQATNSVASRNADQDRKQGRYLNIEVDAVLALPETDGHRD